MTKPMLIRQSPMTRRWYAFTNYEWLDAEHNALVIKGQKRDVTGEIERIIAEVEVSTGEANGLEEHNCPACGRWHSVLKTTSVPQAEPPK